MPNDTPQKPTVKQKVEHELKRMLAITIYLAVFFCAIATYSMQLTGQFHNSAFSYATALINALIFAKVILIGEAFHLGRRQESHPLLYTAVIKSLLFGLLVFAFHIVEDMVENLWHGKRAIDAFQEIHFDQLMGRAAIVFCAFIPLFAFLELQRVLGEETLHRMFFKASTAEKLPSPVKG